MTGKIIKAISGSQQRFTLFAAVIFFMLFSWPVHGQRTILIRPEITYIDASTLARPVQPGDVIRIVAGNREGLKFKNLQGAPGNPIVIINGGGQVNISTQAWGALAFENCRHIRVSGTGSATIRYGFRLQGKECGLSFSEYSSDCEAENIEIVGGENTFFGVYAKKDFNGNPPVPYPVFNNLVLHDLYIHGVTEGMYIGETKSPGMEFHNVLIYNNIVENTGRESIQLANCVENVKVHHNLLQNAGLKGEGWQNNGLQIGANTVGEYHHNIIRDAPGFGAIILGRGNIDFHDNYVENTSGCYIDDRYGTIAEAPVIVQNNFFRNVTGAAIVRNMNEFNAIILQDNQFDTNVPFLNSTGINPPVLIEQRNILTALPPCQLEIVNGLFVPEPGNPAMYAGLGPSHPLPPDRNRIPLNPQMVTDEVAGGSSQTPIYLVDEQWLNPNLNQHPTGNWWQPAEEAGSGPYSVLIDLRSSYRISRVFLHTPGEAGSVVISAGHPGNWTTLFTGQLAGERSWISLPVTSTSRYLRITLPGPVFARINEIALYGEPVLPIYEEEDSDHAQPSFALHRGDVTGQEAPGPAALQICPNPFGSLLTVKPFHRDLKIELIDRLGALALSGQGGSVETSSLPAGVYVVRVTGSDGRVLLVTTGIKYN